LIRPFQQFITHNVDSFVFISKFCHSNLFFKNSQSVVKNDFILQLNYIKMQNIIPIL